MTKAGRATPYLMKLTPLVIVSALLQSKEVEAQGCKTVIWLPENAGSYLQNHTIQTLTTQSESMCKVMCYLSDLCLSYNFHKSTGTCDINDSDEFQHPDDLKAKAGYVYVGIKNGCQSNPCPGNIRCQANFTYEGGFNCLCPSGFTGPSCNNDIDECTTGMHNCSAHSICQNTDGSFYCVCESGYKKQGSSCIPVIGSRVQPAKSCLEILESGDSHGTGEYWLDLNSLRNSIQAFCDMTTDGGGWTKVKRLYLNDSSVPPPKSFNNYSVIAEYNNQDYGIIPTIEAMANIQQKMGFHQIHFYCHQKSVGRVVSIMTKNNTAGQQVVRYFTTKEVTTSFPPACDSFDRLSEDTSILAQNCSLWGKDKRGAVAIDKWGGYYYHGKKRIVRRPFAIYGAEQHIFGCFRGHDKTNEHCACDNPIDGSLSANDTWQIAVR